MSRKNSQDMPINEILKSIRGIINTHQKDNIQPEEDILELKEISEDNVEEIFNKELEEEYFISPELSEHVNASIKSFSNKIKEHSNGKKLSLGDITAEELLLQLLRSELKLWLDKNLPQIIERTFKKELQQLITNVGKNK